jgi:hypothetical protein
VYSILTSKQRYVEKDRYLTARKMSRLSQIARRQLEHTTEPGGCTSPYRQPEIRNRSVGEVSREMHRVSGHRRRGGKEQPVFEQARIRSGRNDGEVNMLSPPTDFHGKH